MLFCSDCMNFSGYTLMDLLEGSRYDDRYHLPVKIWLCSTCKKEIKMIGLICITCGGTGEVTNSNSRIVDCSECKGLACHPKFIEIEKGGKVYSKNMQHLYDNGMDELRRRAKSLDGVS